MKIKKHKKMFAHLSSICYTFSCTTNVLHFLKSEKALYLNCNNLLVFSFSLFHFVIFTLLIEVWIFSA